MSYDLIGNEFYNKETSTNMLQNAAKMMVIIALSFGFEHKQTLSIYKNM